MPVWKKSDDPWDVDPAKVRRRQEKQEREPMENPLRALREWNESRRAEAAAKQAALEARPKEKCPWCGREMERGYLQGGRDRVAWTPGFFTVRAAWLGPPKEAKKRQLRIDHEGDFSAYKTVWYCRECEKMVIDAAGMPEINGEYVWPEKDDSPYAEELHQYFEDAKGDGGEGEAP